MQPEFVHRFAPAGQWADTRGMTRHARRSFRPVLVLALAAVASMAGCRSGREPEPISAANTPPPWRGPVVLDGDTGEWPGGVHAIAGPSWIAVRFETPSRHALQAAPHTTLVEFEILGGDPDPLGPDLTVRLSPPSNDPEAAPGTIGVGVDGVTIGDNNRAVSLGHDQLGLAFSPTYASDTYELRIDRGITGPSGLARELRRTGVAEITIRGTTDAGAAWTAGPYPVVLPAYAPATNPAADLPTRAEGTVRVVSTNVLHTTPAKTPEPFARSYRALAPDIVLVQEWDDFDPDQLADWFETNVGGDWTAASGTGMGVGVATRLPVVFAMTEPLEIEGERYPVRLAAMVVDAPNERILAASVHLKCCGSAGSDEDRRRIEQARAINDRLEELAKAHNAGSIIVGGDINLVGTRTPLDTLAEGIDTNGRDLRTARAMRLGSPTLNTWREDSSSFGPGRLDWILYDSVALEQVRAFVFDAAELSPAARRAAKLAGDETNASDHLPLVVDLRPR